MLACVGQFGVVSAAYGTMQALESSKDGGDFKEEHAAEAAKGLGAKGLGNVFEFAGPTMTRDPGPEESP